MAILSLSQAQGVLSAPRNKKKLKRAEKHEQRMRMHTESILSSDDLTQAHHDYFLKIKALLSNEEKFNRFKECTPLPLPTTSLCESIYQEYPRALRAHNKFIKNTFTSEEMELDFKEYCDHLGFNDFWENEGMDAIKKYINSFIVVDLPRSQNQLRPEPYFYLLHLDHVIDTEVLPRKQCVEYIAFSQEVTADDRLNKIIHRAMVIDDLYYRMFIQRENSGEWVLDYEEIHGMNECPVFKFWADVITYKNSINSASPITTSLGDLEDYLTGKISVKYYKLYGMFPIYWGYKQKCGYIDERGGQCNDKGKVIFYDVDGIDKVPRITDCPSCKARKMMGPGTFIEVDPPEMQGEADLREPVGYVGVDVPALEFAKKDLESARNEITYNTTGKMAIETQSKEALNEMDVARQYQVRKNILIAIKKNFELAIYYTYNFLARLRYESQYISTVVDLGTEFFLQSETELNKDYQDTKNAGRPNYELAAKREFIYLTKYHNNPEKLSKLNILENLEPYQDYSVSEIKNFGIQLADPVGYMIKINFFAYIKRFERENMPILQFGSALSFDKRISIIYETLKKYANEQLQASNSGGGPFAPPVNGIPQRPGTGN